MAADIKAETPAAPKPFGKLADLTFTPEELWAEVKLPPADGSAMDSSSSNKAEKWNGNVSYREALKLAEVGWAEGLAKVAPVVARVDDMIAHAAPTMTMEYDVTGDAPDVGAFLAGVPENMIGMTPTEGAKMVRVIVNVGASWNVSAETLEARGVIACALVDALERVGFRCEVVMAWASDAGDHKFRVKSILKQAEEPLCLDRLVFALAHPAFFRRLMFRVLERAGDQAFRRPFYWGYGSASPVMGAKGDIVIGEMDGSIRWTPEIIADEVARYLKEVGVALEGEPR